MSKLPTTYKEQVEILKSRNIIIEDEIFCINVLSRVNYYRFTAYMLPFKISNSHYSNVAFETIYNIYEFDQKLRSLLLSALEEIEITFRAKLAYYHAHKFGSLGYLDSTNYNSKHRHDSFIDEFNKLVKKNRDNLFVMHHIHNYRGEFPIWVAVELFSFGMISKFYADMIPKEQKSFSRQAYDIGFMQLESWILCLSALRNRCAHHMRLYSYNFNKWPKNTKEMELSNKIFDLIYIMKYFYLNTDKWRNSFLQDLVSLVEEYAVHIDLDCIGFPKDWETALRRERQPQLKHPAAR